MKTLFRKARRDGATEHLSSKAENLHARIAALEAENASYRDTLDRMADVCLAASKGDLETRIIDIAPDAQGADSMHALNHLLDMTDAYVRESRGTLKAASEGRYYRRFMARGLRGSFAQGAIDIDRARAAMAEMEANARTHTHALADEFEREMIHLVEALTDSVESLEGTAVSMTENADGTINRAINVASNAEQTSSLANAIAASSEQLSASISEISRQGGYSADAVKSVNNDVEKAQTAVAGLEDAASNVDRVVAFIRDIAGQTNLLALNATIEAARAGEAGKGFAVVAGEVKALANQSAKATEDIASQIEDMQKATQSTIQSIKAIADQARSLRDVITAITVAVDEQMHATGEISGNIQQAAQGTDQMSERIAEIRATAQNTGQRAKSVLEAAQDMKGRVVTLRAQADHFLKTVRQS